MSHTVWLTRHGNREDFVDESWRTTAVRPHDPGLSPDGIVQAQELADRLQEEGIAHIFASPYLRTVQTASFVADILDLPIKLEAGFGEHLNAAWFNDMPERLSIEELAELYPRIDLSYRDRIIPYYPETWEITAERTALTINQLIADFPEDFLVVGHGATVTAATQGLMGIPVEIKTPLCCLVKLVKEGDRWNMELDGDVAHLSQTEGVIRLN